MALVSMRELLDHAALNGYGIPAFNVNNLEQVQAIMEAARETGAPVIMQASAGARKYAGESFLKHLIQAAVESYPDIPVVMHQEDASVGSRSNRTNHLKKVSDKGPVILVPALVILGVALACHVQDNKTIAGTSEKLAPLPGPPNVIFQRLSFRIEERRVILNLEAVEHEPAGGEQVLAGDTLLIRKRLEASNGV